MIELTGIDVRYQFKAETETEKVIYTYRVRIDPSTISCLTTDSYVEGGNCYVYHRDGSLGVVDTIEEVEAKINAWYNNDY